MQSSRGDTHALSSFCDERHESSYLLTTSQESYLQYPTYIGRPTATEAGELLRLPVFVDIRKNHDDVSYKISGPRMQATSTENTYIQVVSDVTCLHQRLVYDAAMAVVNGTNGTVQYFITHTLTYTYLDSDNAA
jgi:hypothetical protein